MSSALGQNQEMALRIWAVWPQWTVSPTCRRDPGACGRSHSPQKSLSLSRGKRAPSIPEEQEEAARPPLFV